MPTMLFCGTDCVKTRTGFILGATGYYLGIPLWWCLEMPATSCLSASHRKHTMRQAINTLITFIADYREAHVGLANQ